MDLPTPMTHAANVLIIIHIGDICDTSYCLSLICVASLPSKEVQASMDTVVITINFQNSESSIVNKSFDI
jgi:hypothetical protein